MNYQAIRNDLYGAMRKEGIFTWDYMYEQEYALAGVKKVSREIFVELAEATERLGGVFQRAVEVLSQADDELLLGLGIPECALRAVRVRVLEGLPTAIGRFDFAQTTEGMKMLELNSDTPTGIVEAYHVNGRVCSYYGLQDPNEGMRVHIADAFRQVVEAYRRQGYPTERVYFSSLDWHEEDAATTRYLLAQSGLSGEFVALSDLRVYEDRLHVWENGEHKPVDLLYRLHALEKLAEDRDTDGYETGAHVLDLIARRRLGIINPPSAFLAQTKALQAVIWSLHESGAFFEPEEQEAIERFMLPTYLENRFEGTGIPYVSKPILGREGGGVTLYNDKGELWERDGEEFYWEQPMVYQKAVELPEWTVDTINGPYRGRLLWGSFWMGGRASAVVARIGERITGNLSCYLPVAVAE
ncbi:glutathionylspermidine synthase family protein [Paenibacillus aurantius]|uniref:Glutathionylspermidine synthase family protein n=1 Tax=Paenibacillus aurantius TaxID=2918900 RepID=A0AA96LBX4_9BACL|nr:glutathionylspermidine synthase family protein [Paenibacillus aurantius]WNQ11124.1 glutathionylspermidine synthase family protein [Paenibacillus aurantius]